MSSEELRQLNLVAQLRHIQLEWQMDLLTLSRITHVDEENLEFFLNKKNDEMANLPTVPTELQNAVPLVSVFLSLQKSMPDPEKQSEWLVTPNETFEGNKPIDVMAMSPDHLSWVSYTLVSVSELS